MRAPNANPFTERWIGSARRECLDRLLIVNRRHLERVLRSYVRHYNAARPHRGIGLLTPIPRSEPNLAPMVQVHRRDLLGGIVHEYERAA